MGEGWGIFNLLLIRKFIFKLWKYKINVFILMVVRIVIIVKFINVFFSG